MPAYSCIFIYSSSLSSWASCLGTKINEIKEEEEEAGLLANAELLTNAGLLAPAELLLGWIARSR